MINAYLPKEPCKHNFNNASVRDPPQRARFKPFTLSTTLSPSLQEGFRQKGRIERYRSKNLKDFIAGNSEKLVTLNSVLRHDLLIR